MPYLPHASHLLRASGRLCGGHSRAQATTSPSIALISSLLFQVAVCAPPMAAIVCLCPCACRGAKGRSRPSARFVRCPPHKFPLLPSLMLLALFSTPPLLQLTITHKAHALHSSIPSYQLLRSLIRPSEWTSSVVGGGAAARDTRQITSRVATARVVTVARSTTSDRPSMRLCRLVEAPGRCRVSMKAPQRYSPQRGRC